jgi:hypothetical protein
MLMLTTPSGGAVMALSLPEMAEFLRDLGVSELPPEWRLDMVSESEIEPLLTPMSGRPGGPWEKVNQRASVALEPLLIAEMEK